MLSDKPLYSTHTDIDTEIHLQAKSQASTVTRDALATALSAKFIKEVREQTRGHHSPRVIIRTDRQTTSLIIAEGKSPEKVT